MLSKMVISQPPRKHITLFTNSITYWRTGKRRFQKVWFPLWPIWSNQETIRIWCYLSRQRCPFTTRCLKIWMICSVSWGIQILQGLAMVARVCCLRRTGDRNRESSSRLKVKVAEEEENKYGTFTKLATQGSGGVVTGAQMILKWLKDSVLVEETEREWWNHQN